MTMCKILRCVTTTVDYPEGDAGIEEYLPLHLLQCCLDAGKHFLLQTPGGYLAVLLDMQAFSSGEKTDPDEFNAVVCEIEEAAMEFLQMTEKLQPVLKEKFKYLSLGVDIFDQGEPDHSRPHAELVGIYDTKKEKFIQWTGKSSPLPSQTASLMYCNDLSTHFITLDGISTMVLGCHDLNIFSKRSRMSVAEGSYKHRLMNEMDVLVKKHKPTLVLQHPHYTDSPRIWNTAWSGLRDIIPGCHTYASGIHYSNMEGDSPRGSLQSVLNSTKHGNVTDWIHPDNKE